MAKPKAKAAQWVKVDGIGWTKVQITRCPTRRWTHGVKCGGWEPRPHVDMSRRGEIHVVRPRGTVTVGGPLHGSLATPKVEA